MHSFGQRANAIITFSLTILAVICSLASFSDNFNTPFPTAEIEVSNFNWFQKQRNGNDEVSLTLNISADLQSLFTWNTKQVISSIIWFSVFSAAASLAVALFSSRKLNWYACIVFLGAVMTFLRKHCTCLIICPDFVIVIVLDLGGVPRKYFFHVFVFLAAEYGTPQNALNQISLWDAIIPSKEHAKFWIHTSNKYRFIDQGSNLRGKEYNLTLHWHVMPKTGKMFADKIVKTGYRLPEEYR